MTKTLAQIDKEIAVLKRRAEELRKAEVPGVIARIKQAIRHYELTAADLGFSGSRRSRAAGAGKRSSEARYKDPASSRTWTGHGRRPQWFVDAVAAGTSAEDLAI